VLISETDSVILQMRLVVTGTATFVGAPSASPQRIARIQIVSFAKTTNAWIFANVSASEHRTLKTNKDYRVREAAKKLFF